MIRVIINEVREAIQEAFTYALHTNSGSFFLFLARGDYDHRFEGDQFAHLDPKLPPPGRPKSAFGKSLRVLYYR